MFWFWQILNEEVIFIVFGTVCGARGTSSHCSLGRQRWAVRLRTGCSCSVAKSCPTFCEPMKHSTPSSFVLHYLPELPKLMPVESAVLSNHIASSAALFSFCLQSFPASRSFPMSQWTQKWEPLDSTGIMLSRKMWIWGWGKRKKCVWFIRRQELYGRWEKIMMQQSLIKQRHEGKNGWINVFYFVENTFKTHFQEECN